MTSAVLSNINKPQWVETHRFNPNPHFNRFPNPNPNCNFTQKIHVSPHPNLRPLPPPPAIPSVTSSFHGDYVTYDIALYSKRDLKLLKNRLISELQQVRTLLTRIEFKPRQPPRPRPRPPPPLPGPPPPPMSPTLGKAKRVLKRKRGMHLTNRNDKVLMKKCVQILTKLMKEKHGWVFNTPVDTLALRLHDYHDIIKRPMDLGTVKSNLDKNRYKSPLDFAADVRLTFENAMVYNPKGLDVHAMAETLLLKFEQSFNSVYQACKAQRRRVFVGEQVNHCKKNDDLGFSEPTLLSTPQQPQPPPTKTSLVSGPAMTCTGPEGTTRWVKLGKPKAKDVNKRGMSLEEKGRLRVGLQNLPGEKVDQALMIIHKRNNFTLDGDKIELDFEVFDNETLWELDRFLSYHQRALSKMKREGLIGNAASAEEVNKGPDVELTAEGALQKSKKMDDVDEDVDIGEEIPVNNYPPIEIEKDGVAYASSSSSRASSSCSSSSDSNSSSSDTDLGSSSESDDERVQAPAQFVESKEGSVTSSH